MKEYVPIDESDFPEVKDKAVFEAFSELQSTVRDLTRMTRHGIGTAEINETVIQVDLTPSVWHTIEIPALKGPPKGGRVLLVDYQGGYLTGEGFEVVDATHIKAYIAVTPATTRELTTRIWIKGA